LFLESTHSTLMSPGVGFPSGLCLPF
jgi:hypothetical protein